MLLLDQIVLAVFSNLSDSMTHDSMNTLTMNVINMLQFSTFLAIYSTSGDKSKFLLATKFIVHFLKKY